MPSSWELGRGYCEARDGRDNLAKCQRTSTFDLGVTVFQSTVGMSFWKPRASAFTGEGVRVDDAVAAVILPRRFSISALQP